MRAVRRMSLTSTDMPSDELGSTPDEGYAATAKAMEIRDRGRKVKSSKKEITWTVGLCTTNRQFRLLDSIMSGRKQVFVDGVKVHDTKTDRRDWQHVFRIGNFTIKVMIHPTQGKDHPTYDLTINDIPYHRLRRGSIFAEGSAPPPPPPPGAKRAAFRRRASSDTGAGNGDDDDDNGDSGSSGSSTGSGNDCDNGDGKNGGGASGQPTRRGHVDSARKKSKSRRGNSGGKSKRHRKKSTGDKKGSPSNVGSRHSRHSSVDSFDPFAMDGVVSADQAAGNGGFDEFGADFGNTDEFSAACLSPTKMTGALQESNGSVNPFSDF